MRISDWSSDVCSSDLPTARTASAPSICGACPAAASTPCTLTASTLLSSSSYSACTSGLSPSRYRRRRSSPSCLNFARSEEHTSELQSLMRISYAVFCLKKKRQIIQQKALNSTDHTPSKPNHNQPPHNAKQQHAAT